MCTWAGKSSSSVEQCYNLYLLQTESITGLYDQVFIYDFCFCVH
jgi:hypothetical protein